MAKKLMRFNIKEIDSKGRLKADDDFEATSVDAAMNKFIRRWKWSEGYELHAQQIDENRRPLGDVVIW